MKIKVKCPNAECGNALIVESDLAGKKGKCSKCGAIFTIPQVGGGDAKPKSSGTRTGKSATRGGKPAASKKSSAGGKSKASGTARKRPASPPKKKRPKPADDEVFYDAVIEDEPGEDYADYEDYEPSPRRSSSRSSSRGGRRGGGGGRRSRPRDDYEDYEDYDDYEDEPRGGYDDYEDEYDDYEPRSRPAPRAKKKSPKQQWKLVKAGVMLAAIIGCVLAGCYVLRGLPEVIIMLMGASGSGGPSTLDLINTYTTIVKITQYFVTIGGLGLIVGYCFWMVAPTRKNPTLGMVIAATTVAAIGLVMEFIYKLLPIINGTRYVGVASMGTFRSSFTEFIVTTGIIESLYVAELILVALILCSINRERKESWTADSAKRLMIPAIAYGGVVAALGLLFIIANNSSGGGGRGTAKALLWIMTLLRTGVIGMHGWYLVGLVIVLFKTKKSFR